VAVPESDKTAKRSQFPIIWKISAKKYLGSSSWGHLALFGFDPVYNEFGDVMALAWWRMTALALPSLEMRTISSMLASALFKAEASS
jgi:hypothetical protein